MDTGRTPNFRLDGKWGRPFGGGSIIVFALYCGDAKDNHVDFAGRIRCRIERNQILSSRKWKLMLD